MRQQQHYSLAQNQEYPFDDSASLLDDSGNRLPEGLLCDLSCVFSSEYGTRVFCSGATKRGNFCTMVFAADNDEQTSLGLASFELGLREPSLNYGRSPQKPLKGLVPDFRGSYVPGDQWHLVPDGIWRFSNPDNSLVAARCCFPITLPGSQTVAVSYSQRMLQGLVELREEGDVSLRIENRLLGGRVRKAVIISLSRSSVDVLQRYSGQLQQRPESRNCGSPVPIETIGGVGPDCCGRIFIELRGCAEPIPISQHCGVVLDCPLTLVDICPEKKDFGEEDNPDKCLQETGDNPILPAPQQDDFPTYPPNY